MDTRTLGTNLEVSALGLGCMGISHGLGEPADKDESIKIIRRAGSASRSSIRSRSTGHT
jgi:aryl-alcohol dehydrogenase-like predicted oxidoreductase